MLSPKSFIVVLISSSPSIAPLSLCPLVFESDSPSSCWLRNSRIKQARNEQINSHRAASDIAPHRQAGACRFSWIAYKLLEYWCSFRMDTLTRPTQPSSHQKDAVRAMSQRNNDLFFLRPNRQQAKQKKKRNKIPTAKASSTKRWNADELSFIAPQAKYILFFFVRCSRLLLPSSKIHFFFRCWLEWCAYYARMKKRQSKEKGQKQTMKSVVSWRDLPFVWCFFFCFYHNTESVPNHSKRFQCTMCHDTRTLQARTHWECKIILAVSWKYHINQHSYKSVAVVMLLFLIQ